MSSHQTPKYTKDYTVAYERLNLVHAWVRCLQQSSEQRKGSIDLDEEHYERLGMACPTPNGVPIERDVLRRRVMAVMARLEVFRRMKTALRIQFSGVPWFQYPQLHKNIKKDSHSVRSVKRSLFNGDLAVLDAYIDQSAEDALALLKKIKEALGKTDPETQGKPRPIDGWSEDLTLACALTNYLEHGKLDKLPESPTDDEVKVITTALDVMKRNAEGTRERLTTLHKLYSVYRTLKLEAPDVRFEPEHYVYPHRMSHHWFLFDSPEQVKTFEEILVQSKDNRHLEFLWRWERTRAIEREKSLEMEKNSQKVLNVVTVRSLVEVEQGKKEEEMPVSRATQVLKMDWTQHTSQKPRIFGRGENKRVLI